MNKKELLLIARELDIPAEILPFNGSKIRYIAKNDLIEAIVQKRQSQEDQSSSNEEIEIVDEIDNSISETDRLLKGVFTDWDNVYRSLSNVAHTTEKFFVADDSSGDYHDNFDSTTKFKWFVCLQKTWPDYLQHLQNLKNNGMIDDDHDFYDFENNKFLRIPIVEMDNAPYNHKIALSLQYFSKGACTKLLQKLDVRTIKYDHYYKDGTVQRDLVAVVPESNDPWIKQFDYPSADDVRRGTLDAVLEKKPELLEPSYMLLRTKYGFEFEITYTAPYTSPWCCIEYKWADGKGWVANPMNQKQGRTCAEVVELLRNKWYSDVVVNEEIRKPVETSLYIDHCHKLMNEYIQKSCVGSLSGTVDNRTGSSQTESEWEIKKTAAGLRKKHGYEIEVKEDDFDGDINNTTDDGET